MHQPVCRDQTHVGVGADRANAVGNPIADFEILHVRSDRLDRAGAFHPRNKRQTRVWINTRAEVNINVVEADRVLAHQHLALPRLTDVNVFPA